MFTSGTTGRSKGVVLTQKNIASDVVLSAQVCRLYGKTIVALPLYHSFGLIAAILAPLYRGVTIYFGGGIRRLKQDMQRVKPTFVALVPSIIEYFDAAIFKDVRARGKERQLRMAMRASALFRRVGIDVRKRLFAEVRAAFGGEIEFIISGGAPLAPQIARDMEAFGMPVINGYGITECSPIVAMMRNRLKSYDSVGYVLPTLDVRLRDQDAKGVGEICVKGCIVTNGYLEEADNENAFEDGYFCTGDLGKFNRRGCLCVTGRKKNLIITGNGENVSPEALEMKLYACQSVRETIVYMENNALTAEIYIDPAQGEQQDAIRRFIDNMNRSLKPEWRIANTRFRDAPFPKTTSQKIIRNR